MVMIACFWWPPLDELGLSQRAADQTVQAWRSLLKAGKAAARN